VNVPLRHAVQLHLVVAEETAVPVNAALSYDPADPYAVTAVFHADDAAPVEWTFGRDLLMAGTTAPSGEGDVVVWPWTTDGRQVVCIALSSPSGEALLEAASDDVRSFLRASYELLPSGQESEQLDVDSAIDRLLGR
jgi:Streptomyces sporulation and cell division protein, SsgA